MALQQSVGIALAVSTTLPAADTEEAYNSITFTPVGELSEVPDLTGEYDIASFDNLTTGQETKFADINRAGDGEIKLGFNLDDAGQTILETAAADGDSLSLEFTLKDDTKYYRKAIIKSFKPADVSTGNVLMASVMVAFFGVSVKV